MKYVLLSLSFICIIASILSFFIPVTNIVLWQPSEFKLSSVERFNEVSFSQIEDARFGLNNVKIIFGPMPVAKVKPIDVNNETDKKEDINSVTNKEQTEVKFIWRLSGIISDNKGNKATFLNGEKFAVVRNGDVLDGWKVSALKSNSVKLVNGKNVLELKLFNNNVRANGEILSDTSKVMLYEDNRKSIDYFGPVKRDKAWDTNNPNEGAIVTFQRN